MKTLWNYIQAKQQKQKVFEAFRLENGDFDNACSLITDYLEKYIPGIKMLKTAEEVELDGKTLMGMRWLCAETGANVRICWEFNKVNSAWAYCVDFFSNISDLLNGRGCTSFTIYCNGASVALILPIIVDVMSTGTLNMNSPLLRKLQQGTVQECHRIGKLKYRMIREDSTLAQELFRKKKSLQSKKSNSRRMGIDTSSIEDDIAMIDNALNSGDDAVMEETLLSFRRNVPTQTALNPELAAAQRQIEQEQEYFSDPKTAFKMLEKYLVLALKSDRNGVLICGAPGVGKTFRVKKFLNSTLNPATGQPFVWSPDNIVGDIIILKGKVTPAELYKMFWRTKEYGQVLFIDDCDSAITDPGAINLMKAALEGGKDRLITYAIKGKIYDVDPFDPTENIELPKSFNYNGKIIILTNLRAGEVDTAIRSRVYIQDINFTVQSVLQIIEEVMPTMDEFSEEGKRLALEFLKKLAEEGKPIEISLRTFGTCADILTVFDTSDEREIVYKMIEENMRLQSDRGGGRY